MEKFGQRMIVCAKRWLEKCPFPADERGALIPMAALAFIVVLAMLGSGLDLGRAYMAKSRLQHACDAGVLAGRAELSHAEWGNGAEGTANSMFTENFPEGTYGSSDLAFKYGASSTKLVTGQASVIVPTTLMRLFGVGSIPVAARCAAETQMPNVDIMFVLDTTWSMNETNPGDSKSRINVMRDAVRNFYTFVEGNKVDGAQTRYGAVPYSTNVNVGHLLKPEWMVDNWTYQSRRQEGFDDSQTPVPDEESYYGWTGVSGTESSTYSVIAEGACIAPPAEDWTDVRTEVVLSDTTTPDGVKTVIKAVRNTQNGTTYWTDTGSGECRIYRSVRVNYVEEHEERFVYYGPGTPLYWYGPISYNLAPIKANVSGGFLTGSGAINVPVGARATNVVAEWNGCIEERDTVNTSISGSIPAIAYDLSIDLVPTADPATRWRPSLPAVILARWDLVNWQYEPYLSKWHNMNIGAVDGGRLTYCPSRAVRLQVTNEAALEGYLAGLSVGGSTYHDIGMIWGARLLSGEGLFAAENNVSSNGGPISRHLILMTDGQTDAEMNTYGAYGYEALDRRRTPIGHPPTNAELNAVVDARFQAICSAARAKFTVWVIAFGTELTPNLENCATPGSAFQAANATELNKAFTDISGRIANLRLTQ